jgi:hypothetical protein
MEVFCPCKATSQIELPGLSQVVSDSKVASPVEVLALLRTLGALAQISPYLLLRAPEEIIAFTDRVQESRSHLISRSTAKVA